MVTDSLFFGDFFILQEVDQKIGFFFFFLPPFWPGFV